MDWLITLVAVAVLIAIMPRAIIAATRLARGKGRAGAMMLSLGMAFGAILDQPKRERVEEVAPRADAEDDPADTLE